MPLDRNDVTEKIIAGKTKKNLEWADIALQIGASKGKTVSGCLGQAAFSQEQAELLAQIFDLDAAEKQCLTVQPSPLSPDQDMTDPLLQSLQEIISRYGGAIKEMFQDKFGPGQLQNHDLSIEIKEIESRETLHADNPNPRVQILFDTRFIPLQTATA